MSAALQYNYYNHLIDMCRNSEIHIGESIIKSSDCETLPGINKFFINTQFNYCPLI